MSGEPLQPVEEVPEEVPAGSADPPGQPAGDSPPAGGPPADGPAEEARPADEVEPGEEEEGVVADAEVDLLAQALRERDDYLDALRRLQADFENYRKRTVKQQAEVSARAAESLAEKLLPVLDVADLAVSHGAGAEVEQVWTALLDALEGEGLERIDPAGGAFDPNRHDAVVHDPGEAERDGGQEVTEVLRAGYAWKGRVLRPAMVKVRG